MKDIFKITGVRRIAVVFLILLFIFCIGCALTQTELISGNTGAHQQTAEMSSVSEAEDYASAQPSASESAGFSSQEDDMNDRRTENTNVQMVSLKVNGTDLTVRLEDNETAKEFAEMFADSPLTLELSDYGGFEKVGSLGRELISDNVNMTAQPGDIMLYNGSNIVIFYGSNTWDYTKIGSVSDFDGWSDALGEGDVTAVFGEE